ncbi:hypothetical protein F4561_006215 [Lipingzhangella halophila]|uniref:DUF3224 domain-containing protein n=1 Tax=Lipingzhangella halophila TaxID=1783352 RepID=A0A7W7RPQ8_9ACTN|nr:DUF3224 domain-containing protein [Lipingzhangella halophila]MBB4935321.1 hypothetical protein [Lipingzhangella halophila]
MSYPHKATSTFNVTSWSENLVTDIDGTGTTAGDAYYPDRGVTRADVTYAYTGEIEGTGTVAYLISYKSDAAPVLAFERFEGSIAGHEGTCLFRHVGTQDKGSVSVRLEAVPGMGTGGLETLRGEADVAINGHSEDGYPLTLSFDVS